jgi:hypothetical protein
MSKNRVSSKVLNSKKSRASLQRVAEEDFESRTVREIIRDGGGVRLFKEMRTKHRDVLSER